MRWGMGRSAELLGDTRRRLRVCVCVCVVPGPGVAMAKDGTKAVDEVSRQVSRQRMHTASGQIM